MPKYPDIEVNLSGIDGNAFNIIGEVIYALRKGGVSDAEQREYRDESMSGDYDNLVATAFKWVSVC